MNTPHRIIHPSQFGLIAWLEQTRIVLPLKGTECRFNVTGALACVELDQIYHQSADRPLDCTYTFPLPAGAAVYRCELHVNGRVIRAKVEESGEARRIFAEQKAAGHRAALVESHRENVFELALGNVQPDDVIVVRFAWFQTLDRSPDGLRLFVPTCLGVRYIPGKPLLRASSGHGVIDDTDEVPDASRLTPPRIDALHPDAAYFSLEGRLAFEEVETDTISSPSHSIYVRQNLGTTLIALSEEGHVPGRDFVLTWKESPAVQLAPRSWGWSDGNATYALVQLRAPEQVKVVENLTQDVYFLVDRSGSMSGAKWHRTCEALRAFVRLLGAEDRVWITLFESSYRDFAESPMAAPAVLADAGFQGMESLGVAGGTELLPAARHVIENISAHSQQRRASVVLITDGQVGNDQAIIELFQKIPDVRVHTFGIDVAVNDAFLKSLAHQQHGGCWLRTPDDQITGTIASLGDRLRRPVLTDLAIDHGWESGRAALPDLYARDIVTIPLRGNNSQALRITGLQPNGQTHQLTVEVNATGSEAIKLLWARERIDTLLAAKKPAEAIAVAKEHNLICQGAAFIAWDEAEKVQISQETIIQPAIAAHIARIRAKMGGTVPGELQRMAIRLPFLDAHSDEHMVCQKKLPSPAEMLCSGFQWARIKRSTAEAIVNWARSTEGNNNWRYLIPLSQAAGILGALREKLSSPIFAQYFESTAKQALNDSPEAVFKWYENLAKHSEALRNLITSLEQNGLPKELVSELLAWVLESGTVNGERMDQLKAVATHVDPKHFSRSPQVRCWWQFLEKTFPKDSNVMVVAKRYLPRSAAPSAKPVS